MPAVGTPQAFVDTLVPSAPPLPPPLPATTSRRRGRVAVILTAAVAAVALVALVIALLPSTTAGPASSTPRIPVTIAGPMDVWLVGSPDQLAPAATLPTAFAALLASHNVTPRVVAKSAAEFPQAFQDAVTRGQVPEIVGGQNYLPFEGIASNTLTSVQALIRADTGALRQSLSTSSIQFPSSRFPAEVRDIQVCHQAGNEVVRLVYLSATFASDTSSGQCDYMVVLVRERADWKVLGRRMHV